MGIITERLFLDPKVFTQFKPEEWKKYIRVKNFIYPVIILLFLRIIGISTIFVLIIVFISYYYFTNKNIEKKVKKVEFLNNIMYNGETEPYGTRSFLNFSPEIVNFYYKNKDYIDFNLSSFRKSLENVNNLLQLEFNMNQVIKYPEQIFENALIQYKQALNNFHSVIYKLPSTTFSNYRLDDNLNDLRKILLKHLKKMLKIINNKNEYDLDIYSTPDPLKLISDLNDKNYSTHYSFY